MFRDSTSLLFDSFFFASRCGISGDSRPAILGIVRDSRFCAAELLPLNPWRNYMNPPLSSDCPLSGEHPVTVGSEVLKQCCSACVSASHSVLCREKPFFFSMLASANVL